MCDSADIRQPHRLMPGAARGTSQRRVNARVAVAERERESALLMRREAKAGGHRQFAPVCGSGGLRLCEKKNALGFLLGSGASCGGLCSHLPQLAWRPAGLRRTERLLRPVLALLSL
jgi:hypothetical protein